MKCHESLLKKYQEAKNKVLATNQTQQYSAGISNQQSETREHESLKEGDDINLRVILGEYMENGHYKSGEYSFPGPDITYQSPPSNEMVVCLGCMANRAGNGDTVNLIWPVTQIPARFGTGSAETNATVYTGDLGLNPVNWLPIYFPELQTEEYNNFVFPDQTYVSTGNTNTVGQPNTGEHDNEFRANRLNSGSNTTFQSRRRSGLSSAGMNLTATANGYSSVNLSQEGILWTLWPLAKPKRSSKVDSHVKTTYFNDLQFGTAMHSNYRIGQMGYFYNDANQGCIPIGANLSGFSTSTGPINTQLLGEVGIYTTLAPYNRKRQRQINTGIQGFYRTLLISTSQILAVLVVKVSEEIARVLNPASGEMGQDRFIYVGYDGWAVVRTSANPVGPMMAQTYVTPQTVTGNLNAKDNYQVIIPPNFISTVYYKNRERNVPTDTRSGISNPGLYVPFYSDDNRFVNQTDEFLRGLASAIAELGNPELNDIISQVNNINNPYEVINLINAITTPEYLNTTLGGRPLPVNIVPFNNIIEQQRLSLRTDEDRGTINFDLNNGMPTYIDGQLQLYPRFSSSIRPYAQALVNSPPADISNLDDIITPGRN